MKEVSRLCDYPLKRGKAEICGRKTDQPTTFALNAFTYEIDLCEEHLPKLEEALAKFVEAAVPAEPADPGFIRVGNATRRVMRGKAAGTLFTEADVRAWLREQGRDVPPTGRISQKAKAEYQDALANGRVHH